MKYHEAYFLSGSLPLFLYLYMYLMLPMVSGIMVPTGKLTPIQPAEPSTKPPVPIAGAPSPIHPAPVSEYTVENPEPAPLDPSYVPIQYDYLQYLKPTAVLYVPIRIKPAHSEKPETKKAIEKYLWKYGKVPDKLSQKYESYPINLQRKYIYYILKTAGTSDKL